VSDRGGGQGVDAGHAGVEAYLAEMHGNPLAYGWPARSTPFTEVQEEGGEGCNLSGQAQAAGQGLQGAGSKVRDIGLGRGQATQILTLRWQAQVLWWQALILR